MLRIWIATLVMTVIIGTAGQSSADLSHKGLRDLLASCSDARAVKSELNRAMAIVELCENTMPDRLFSPDLSALDRACDEMETSFVLGYASLLADPAKSDVTCAEIQTLLETVNKAFRDGMNR